ncbi:MAG: putative lipoprotein YmbA [Halieaceae bacterium]|jgi:uncharacterized lipoprotein YmbA
MKSVAVASRETGSTAARRAHRLGSNSPRILLAMLLGLTLSLAGCAGRTLAITHLQLSAGDAAPGTGIKPVIVIDRIGIPDFLLRDAFLLRSDAYELHYHSSLRWAEPLDLGIQRVLARRLSAALDTREITSYPQLRGSAADSKLHIDVQHFEALGEEVILEARVKLEFPKAAERATQVLTFEGRKGIDINSGSAVAATMSELLWEFSEFIATAIDEAP